MPKKYTIICIVSALIGLFSLQYCGTTSNNPSAQNQVLSSDAAANAPNDVQTYTSASTTIKNKLAAAELAKSLKDLPQSEFDTVSSAYLGVLKTILATV